MQKIRNMRVVSDDPSLLHLNCFNPVTIGTIETIDGKDYRVIDNSQMTTVTYEPVTPAEIKPKVVIKITIDEEQADRFEQTTELMAEVAKVLDAGDADMHPSIVNNEKGEQIGTVEYELKA